MSERVPAPGDLALIEALVNTLDIETGTDELDTAAGRAPSASRSRTYRPPANSASPYEPPSSPTRATRRTARPPRSANSCRGPRW